MFLSVILIILAYVLGSIPFALVIGKGVYGVDVRQQGSGNIGTTTVFRVLGKKAGLLVFAGDLAKGFLPVLVAMRAAPADNVHLVTALVAAAAIAGHNWSIFLRGRGGKGVATGGGVILAMMPWLFLLAFAVFWLVLLPDRRVSVASLSAATGLSVAALATGQPAAYIIFVLIGTAVVFYAHRSNIRRIARGEESRVDLTPVRIHTSRKGKGGGGPEATGTDAGPEAGGSGKEEQPEPATVSPAARDNAPASELFEWEDPAP